MSSLNRLLHLPAVDVEPRPLSAPDPALDAFTRARVEEAAADAYERGRRDGAEMARAAAVAAAERVAAAVDTARDAAVAELRRLRAAETRTDVELATAIAAVVLGREPHDGGQALLARLGEALAALDDAPLVIRVHPEDAELVRAGTRGDQVTVDADPSLGLGEARITGPWSRAELTRETAWQTVREALEGDSSV